MADSFIFSSFHIRHVCDVPDDETNKHTLLSRCLIACTGHKTLLHGDSLLSTPMLPSHESLSTTLGRHKVPPIEGFTMRGVTIQHLRYPRKSVAEYKHSSVFQVNSTSGC